MKLTHLRTNHIVNPLGLAMEHPVFSWVAGNTIDKKQAAAQITVATGGNTVFDSGKRADISSLGFEVPIPLAPRTRYDWTVTVWGDGGDCASACSWFETAKQDEPWQARWISGGFTDKETQPLLAKEFTFAGEVASARAYVCGLGIYELEINGQKAGDEYLLPGYHCYDFALEYQTFDVTSLLQAGQNVIGLALGPGWYKGDIVFSRYHDLYGDTMQAICELHITAKDGSETMICSDNSWKSYPSPVTFSNIYDGEHFDANRLVPGWSAPGCTASAHPAIERVEQTPLVPRRGPKIVKKKEFAPMEVIHTPKGETVLDFGQNMTGWVEFNVDVPAGRTVKLSYGEVMQQGCFYRDNLRSAKAKYIYISDGKPRRVRPRFTFYGFRYVMVEGLETLNPGDFTACHIRSDIDPIGHIETDNVRVNQLFHNALWGQFDNFLDLPTDCPQRDERLGWTGDAAIISATACKNIYMPAFFHHFMENVRAEQIYHKGAVPVYVPAPKAAEERTFEFDIDPADFVRLKPEDTEGLAAALAKYPALRAAMEARPAGEREEFLKGVLADNISFEKNNHKGCAIWSDVATMMPWAVYENYGDLALLRAEYPVMKAWVERIRQDDQLDGNRGLWLRGNQLGDWLALDKPDPKDAENPFGATDLQYTASCFYFYSTLLTAKAAKALGYEKDAADYTALHEKIRTAIVGEYFHADGSFKIEGTQTACVLSLFFGLYPQGCKDRVMEQLKDRLKAKNWHLDTGFCGTPFLCRALSDNGANDVAYTLFLNDDYPSWLNEVKLGATTVWERWNSLLPDGSISGMGMNSLNHYAYGSIVDWMYRNMCGFNPVEDAPGYKRAIIRPMPDPRIRSAKMSMHTASGFYEVSWRYDGETLHYTVTIPFDCTARLSLPDGREATLSAGTYHF
ncbi:family 78 glycoside hydrolase catalytic domain [Acutalibacter caecimuris]|uniref:family 78 glycoside hydrolase catalytic domain n=1 Tax=Acutalibacter caecimuris TaxID=3093657 RepID=UPI002AC96860|nr:family 78 glycoside hydrolase catalytic domain [Acutalibacter sp. M00118]